MNFKDKLKMKELSIVIPVYKEKKNLDKLSDLLIKTKFQVFFVSIYFLTYSISALLNSYYKISLNYFW